MGERRPPARPAVRFVLPDEDLYRAPVCLPLPQSQPLNRGAGVSPAGRPRWPRPGSGAPCANDVRSCGLSPFRGEEGIFKLTP